MKEIDVNLIKELLEEITQLKVFMGGSTARLSYLDRWMVYDDGYWFVYEQKKHQRVKVAGNTASFKKALDLLKNQKQSGS